MHCTSMWPDAPKIKNLLLSQPLFYSTLYPFVRTDDARFDGNTDRINQADIRIVAIDGALSYNLAKDAFPNAKIVSLPNSVQDAEYLMTVSTGKADIVIMDKDEIKKFMENNPGKLRQVENVPPVRVFPHVLAFKQGDDDLARAINFALGLIIDNGRMKEILKKYSANYLLPNPAFDAGK